MYELNRNLCQQFEISVVNPLCMHKAYGSLSVCVCVCVCVLPLVKNNVRIESHTHVIHNENSQNMLINVSSSYRFVMCSN